VVAPAATPTRTSIPEFRHVFVVVFENEERASVLGSGAAPNFDRLGRRYATLPAYYGVAHPSLPNYLALVSGSTQGVTSDCTACAVGGRSLADTIERSGRTWKAYAEGLPAPGFTGAFAGRYAKKHMPFLYFRDVLGKPSRRARVFPLTQLAKDLPAGRLPDFALIVPDLCNSMHDCPVATGDAWLHRVVEPLLSRKELAASVVFVVFDEGSSSARGGGNVPALALGPAVRRGATFRGATGHYGLLRTIEDAWRLPRLGASAKARPITGIWR
jgi:hypothetical protein